jgi:hypothetical protein
LNLKNLLFGTQEAGAVSYGIAKDTEDWLPVKDIQNGIVLLKDGRFIKLVEITPVNFYLKSYREQENIIASFAAYLKVAPDNLQIRILTQKADLEASMDRMWEKYDDEPETETRDMIEKGVYLLNTLAQNQTLRRRFFLVFQHVGGKIGEAVAKLEKDAYVAAGMLEECGLEVTFPDSDATRDVFHQILNKRTSRYLTLEEPTTGSVPYRLAPGSVDTTHKGYIEVDGIYHSTLYVAGYGYPTKVFAGWLGFLVEAGEGISLSFHLQRQRKDKAISKISKTTMISRSRMRDVGDTRADYEELESAIFSGMYLKDGMNRSMQDLYYMNTLIEVSAESVELLERRIESVKVLCTANNYIVKRADYRHEQGFLSCLPTLSLDPDLFRKSRRNILTDSLAAAFPFCSFELYDPDGILLGQNLYNASVAMLDIFDSSKYSNANMCVMGTSGAGKTYLLQLLAMRHRCQGTQVFIIAPLKGHEFRPACDAIGGRYIKLSPASQECVNVMEVRQRDVASNGGCDRKTRKDSLLASKIQKLHIFFTLIKPNITYEERHFLDNALVETYKRFGMNHDNASLYLNSGELKPPPCLADLYEVLSANPETKLLSQVLSRFVTGSAKRLGGHTNVDLTNKYIVLDISEMNAELLPMGMFVALDFVWDEVKRSRVAKKVVILDELWNLIGASSTSLAAKYVVEIFKTIRGLGGAAIGATQDLNDFFTLDNGDYGKGILGNSRIKIVMQMEQDEAERVQKIMSLSDEETTQILRYKRGQGLLISSFVRTCIGFASSTDEYGWISTSREAVAARYGG